MRQIVLDTETTGLEISEGNRIIEIGCVELINRRITSNIFHCYLNPQRSIHKEASEVHHLTDEFLKDKPLFADIADNFYQFIQGAELIAHNASFDVNFLDYEFSLLPSHAKKIEEICHVIDTLILARQLHPGQQNNLDALCKRYQLDTSERMEKGHGALLDAKLLAQLYLLMTSGQSTFFDETPSSQLFLSTDALSDTKTTELPPTSRIIINANPEEQIAHQKFLDVLTKASGKTVDW